MSSHLTKSNSLLVTPPTTILRYLQNLPRSSYLLISPPSTDDDNNNYHTRTPSSPTTTTTTNRNHHRHLTHLIRKTSHTLRLQLSLPTVSSTIISSFPTSHDISSSLQMARRSGVRSILAVGGGATMDLAKSVLESADDNEFERLILVPGTLGGVMAARTSRSLILSTEEEMLLWSNNGGASSNNNLTTTPKVIVGGEGDINIPLVVSRKTKDLWSRRTDETSGIPSDGIDALIASLSLMTNDDDNNNNENDEDQIERKRQVVTNARLILDGDVHNEFIDNDEVITGTTKQTIIDTVTTASLFVNSMEHQTTTTNRKKKRSIASALSMSLLPRYFPRAHLFSFWSSLLPGLCDVVEEEGRMMDGAEADELLRRYNVPSLAEMAMGAPDVEKMVDMVMENGSLLGVVDDLDKVEKVLRRSLNR